MATQIDQIKRILHNLVISKGRPGRVAPRPELANGLPFLGWRPPVAFLHILAHFCRVVLWVGSCAPLLRGSSAVPRVGRKEGGWNSLEA